MGERAHWGRLIGGSLAVLAAAFIAPRFVLAPDLAENRTLATAPRPPRGLGDLNAYRRAVDAFVADQFPPRAHLIGGLNRLRLALGVSGSPRVLVGRDGWLFYDDGGHLGPSRGEPALTDAAAGVWLAGLAGRTEAMAAQGKAYVVISPPQKESLFPQYAPGWFRLDANRPAVTLSRLAQASKAGDVIYFDQVLAQPSDWGLKTYARHDTHWTGLGAYLGYAAFMRDLNARGLAEAPRPLEAFQEVRRGDRNKPRNLALMLGVGGTVDVDYPELGDPASEAILKVSFLDPKRHDWTGLRVIDTGQTGKPVLLMTLDSFSNAFLPLLFTHFSRIVTAHVDQGAWRPDLIARFNPDIVVTEVLESGLPSVMASSPPASPEALARIAATVRQRDRYRVRTVAVAAARATPFKVQEGDDGPNVLTGTDARDEIQGRQGDDTVSGLGGADVLRGGRGADRLDGGDGDDWLSGGRGNDTLTGGRGADVFNTGADGGDDLVTDFSIAEGDQVELDPGTTFTVRQDGADAVVEMTGGRLVLKGATAADLKPGVIRVRPVSLASGA